MARLEALQLLGLIGGIAPQADDHWKASCSRKRREVHRQAPIDPGRRAPGARRGGPDTLPGVGLPEQPRRRFKAPAAQRVVLELVSEGDEQPIVHEGQLVLREQVRGHDILVRGRDREPEMAWDIVARKPVLRAAYDVLTSDRRAIRE